MLKTPLHALHQESGAKIVDFSGYAMPLSYEGILSEHETVRRDVGLFDVSHMGEFRIQGAGAGGFLDRLVTNAVGGLVDGQALYSPMCNEAGGTVDDLIVYRFAANDFLVVVNASNIDKDFAWMQAQLPGDASVQLSNVSEEKALIAVQGPRAVELLQRASSDAPESIEYYHFARGQVFGHPATIARLGYTGEDGFELMVDAAAAADIWTRLLREGDDLGARPAGLGARDTLRFEVCFCLYGHELRDDVSPLEAGIGWTVKLDDADFVGHAALAKQKVEGIPRRLIGITMEGRRVPRQGSAVLAGGDVIGEVTSGMFAPTLGGAAALALVEKGRAKVGETVELDLRGTQLPARVTKKPFYRRDDG